MKKNLYTLIIMLFGIVLLSGCQNDDDKETIFEGTVKITLRNAQPETTYLISVEPLMADYQYAFYEKELYGTGTRTATIPLNIGNYRIRLTIKYGAELKTWNVQVRSGQTVNLEYSLK